MIIGKIYKEKNMYESFLGTFKTIVHKNTPLKENIVRGSSALFMAKELKKAIINRSRLKRNIKTGPLEEKNKCNKLCRKAKKDHFKDYITENNLNINKKVLVVYKTFFHEQGSLWNKFYPIQKRQPV